MDDAPPDSATRILALMLAISIVVVWMPFTLDAGIHTVDFARYAWVFHDVVELLALLGLVLRTERRGVPVFAFVVWLFMPTVGTMLQVALGPDVSPLTIMGPESLVYTGLLAVIAWERAGSGGWLVGLLCVHFVSKILLNVLGVGAVGSIQVASNALVTLPLLGAVLLLARNARPSSRSDGAFPLTMLAWLPLARFWTLLGAFDPVARNLDERGLVVRFQATEIGLFAVSWVAFEMLRSHGRDTRGVRPVMAIAGGALLVPAGLQFLNERHYRAWSDVEVPYYGSLLVAVVLTVLAFTLQLRALATIARSDRLVLRAWVTGGLVVLPMLTGVLTVTGAQFIRPSDPMSWAIYLGGAVTFGLMCLASLSWSFFVFGLSHTMSRDRPSTPE